MTDKVPPGDDKWIEANKAVLSVTADAIVNKPNMSLIILIAERHVDEVSIVSAVDDISTLHVLGGAIYTLAAKLMPHRQTIAAEQKLYEMSTPSKEVH